MNLKSYFFLFIILGSLTQVYAQLNATVTGDAINQGNNCYVITPDQLDQAGGVWYDNPIDFDSNFTIYYQNVFGNKDANGADGMALVFKGNPTPVIGGTGGGLGYNGVSSSLVIEFDTYQNNGNGVELYGDPVYDHIAIIQNGSPDHNNTFNNLAGPIQASISSPNIEDGNSHEVKIVWNATTKVLSVFFDCVLRLTLNQDVKSTIFSGDDTVYFGFVGSTGGLSNVQRVCFNSISFVDNLQLQDETICLGNSTNVDATMPSGNTYSWTPTTGVSNPNIANPDLSPTLTTTYTVTISDVCGETTSEDITITVLPFIDPVFDPVPAICEGDALNELPSVSNNGISGTWAPELDNSKTTTYTFTPSNGECAFEATLEIIVNPTLTPIFDAVNQICPGEFLEELPVTASNGFTGSWSPALNNMQTTVYTFTPDSGQGCAGPATLEIIVTDPIVPTFDFFNSVCEGDVVDDFPTTSTEGITGIWSPAFNNLVTTTYTFTPDGGQCSIETALEIQVIPISELVIEVEIISEPFSDNQTVVANVAGGTGTYEFQLDNGPWLKENSFNGITGCDEHVLRAREISGCSNIALGVFRVLDYPKVFTPNGDTYKDSWNIDCLREQTSARISIYDRYGKMLAVIYPSGFGWNGIYNGALMPTNDYWFEVDYFGEDGSPRVFRSHFTLKR